MSATLPSPPDDGRPPLIELAGVRRRFGDVDALAGLDLVVPANRITVLLGPNGAGKTTAIRMITGALDAHAGMVRTFGLDPSVHGEEVRRRCGVVSAKPALYDRLSGFDNLLYAAQLYEVPERGRDERIRTAARQFGIEGALEHQVGGYSTGMRTRLALARSIIHQPDLLLYDEPTSGLDPESAQSVLAMIHQMRLEGRTVVMCTHLLAEAEGLADHIVVMEAGTSPCFGSATELTHRYWPGAVVHLAAESPDQLDRVATWHGVTGYERVTDLARIELDGIGRIPDLVLGLARDGVRITRVEPQIPTLEDLYFAIRREAQGAGLAPVGSSPSLPLGSLAASGSPAVGSIRPVEEVRS